MFSKAINGDTVTLGGRVANKMFPNITGTPFGDDVSFVATLRALLPQRMKPDDKVSVYTHRLSMPVGADYISGDNIGVPTSDSLRIISIEGSDDDIKKVMEDVTKKYPVMCQENGVNLEYVENKTKGIAHLLNDRVQIRVFSATEIRSTVVLIERLDMRKYHFMQVFISVLLPWYFAGDNVITAEEKELIRSLNQRTSEVYETLMSEYADRVGMKEAILNDMISRVREKALAAQIRNAESELRNLRSEMENLNERYRELMLSYDNQNTMIIGLKHRDVSKADDELLDYFKHHPFIDPVQVRDERITFIIRSRIQYFDTKIFNTYIENPRSYINQVEVNDKFRDVNVRAKFLKAIFSDDPKLFIRVVGAYDLDMRGEVNAPRDYPYSKTYKDFIPNEHLHRHGCLGDYRRLIRDSLMSGDLQMALDYCVASCGSVNIAEGATFPFFLSNIFRSNGKIIETKDGQIMTVEEAITWLNEHEETEEAKEK